MTYANRRSAAMPRANRVRELRDGAMMPKEIAGVIGVGIGTIYGLLKMTEQKGPPPSALPRGAGDAPRWHPDRITLTIAREGRAEIEAALARKAADKRSRICNSD